ncbi:MAG: cytochrome-c peroxidase [Methylomonas sp.]|uniref:cytochrome-c peroxidase n=1 Tax=Methylomonas sp. TaxID=418 RepID=UPI0025EF9AA9|nr:cytochrome c peroxidase [Methylomonas sp.]MCK9604891.1 cytochrome-c peroxidase [Methylomonas sp.]
MSLKPYPTSMLVLSIIAVTGMSTPARSDGFGPMPISLKNVPIPEVPGLLDGPEPIVVDKKVAIQLGKALFWDSNVGSDGMACASCHFHAGADSRVKNQLAPGGVSLSETASTFEATGTDNSGGPNYTLKKDDFPFLQRSNDFDTTSPITFQTDDVVSSSGTFSGDYIGEAPYGSGDDICDRNADAVFHVGAIGTRKVPPRNAPSVINAVFNYRNFWDGRANNVFNGNNPWGDRDPDAGVWISTNRTTVKKQRLHLINSSLASVATAPPLNDSEMSCRQRTFKSLARKLLDRKPLENQKVHYNDSVLTGLTFSTPGNLLSGLETSYRMMIMEAFNRKYWSYAKRDNFGRPADPNQPAYSQIEANFPLFFGLAIQLYESTLVSDDSPFDRSARDAQGVPVDLTEAERRGLEQFRNGHCAMCHVGPTFTSATVATNALLVKTHPEAFGNEIISLATSNNVVGRSLSLAGRTLSDTGFTSTGVTPLDGDIGLGGVDTFGKPLSFSLQYLQFLAANDNGIYDGEVRNVRPCDFQQQLAADTNKTSRKMFTAVDGVMPQAQATDDCIQPNWAYQPTPAAILTELSKADAGKALAVMEGAFKIPGLRNIELTGPYMHNGGMANLEQVVTFYARGGNFDTPGKDFGFVGGSGELITSAQARADLAAFLKTLTDDRVRYEKAPFDHPEIKIPHGHVGDHMTAFGGHQLSNQLALDEFLILDAVGAEGKPQPNLPFEDYLE